MPIEAVAGLAPAGITSPAGAGRSAGLSGPGSFGESLSKLIGNVEQTSTDANKAVGNMLDQTGDVHDAMIALQRAEMTLELTVQIRNKLVQAYQDIMRMPV
jgi:flagellar hook-basal body complex protein FliE